MDIVAAINAIGTAISNVIGSGLQAIDSALGAVNTILNTINSFFQNQIYPQAAINRARGVVGAVQGIYNAIRGLVNLNVASATLANPRQLETVLLSRNPANIGQVPGRFTTVYQAIPAPTDAPAAIRDLIDMTDATAQAAFKKAIAIDAAADQLMDASDQLAGELAVAAPGTWRASPSTTYRTGRCSVGWWKRSKAKVVARNPRTVRATARLATERRVARLV